MYRINNELSDASRWSNKFKETSQELVGGLVAGCSHYDATRALFPLSGAMRAMATLVGKATALEG